MNILKKDELMNLCDGHIVSGLALVGNYTIQPTKTGKTFIGGVLNLGQEMQFKAWQGNCYDDLEKNDYQGKICSITAKINEYNGTKSLILSEISEVPESSLKTMGVFKSDFFEPKYDGNKMYEIICNTLEKNVSENAYKVFKLVMADIEERVKVEFAAIGHHDNCISGLVAHMAKVLKASMLVKNYPNILKAVSADLLFVGCAIHDIGKVVEYNTGVISEMGKKISHLTIGCLMLEKNKDEIVNLMGEDYYYSLLSVIAQHHGEYEETPRTLAAYIVNQFDCFDSVMTSIDEVVAESGGNQISFDNMKLSF